MGMWETGMQTARRPRARLYCLKEGRTARSGQRRRHAIHQNRGASQTRRELTYGRLPQRRASISSV